MHISFINWLESKKLENGDKAENPAGIFFTNGKKVLLLQKPNKKWSLPGGHAKEGETPLQTAERESLEECGKVEGENIGSIKTDNWTAFFYKVESLFDCQISNEHIDWNWFDIDETKNIKLTKKFSMNLDKYLKILKSLSSRF
jgi:8-oxo-dGTP pyrophosphatase MutT (NUDIX family)